MYNVIRFEKDTMQVLSFCQCGQSHNAINSLVNFEQKVFNTTAQRHEMSVFGAVDVYFFNELWTGENYE